MKDSWQIKNLGTLCRIRTGKKDVNEGDPKGKFPFFTCAAKHTYSNSYSFDTEALLIAGNGDVGKVSYYKGKFEAYQRTYVLSDFSKVLPRFLYLVLDGKLKDTVSKQKLGNTMPYIKVGMLTNFHLPVPSIPEQERIIKKLDDIFEATAKAKENAERNLNNAHRIFESYIQSIFTNHGPGWTEKHLGDIAEFKNGLNFNQQSKGQNILIVGVGNFQDHSIVPIETLQSVTIDGEIAENYLIRRDDILTVRSNGSKNLVGRCMLVPEVEGMISYSGFIIRIRFNTREISPRFLLHFMKSSATRNHLTSDGGGANISNINQTKLSQLPISLPSFSQQENIANQLDALFVETQRLAVIYEQKLAVLEELKKSILKKAFEGAL